MITCPLSCTEIRPSPLPWHLVSRSNAGAWARQPPRREPQKSMLRLLENKETVTFQVPSSWRFFSNVAQRTRSSGERVDTLKRGFEGLACEIVRQIIVKNDKKERLILSGKGKATRWKDVVGVESR